MNPEVIGRLVASLGLMKFFPSDPNVRVALVEVLGDICETEEQVRWLVKELRVRYAEWPGEQEMRYLFCRHFRPRDGIIISKSVGDFAGEVYSFILRPNDPWPPPNQIEWPTIPLPRGVTSADPELDRAVKQIAAQKGLDSRK